jgi:GNAT superfamily N-acetyltransferase
MNTHVTPKAPLARPPSAQSRAVCRVLRRLPVPWPGFSLARFFLGSAAQPGEDHAMIDITPLTDADRPAWEALFRAYMAFYRRDEPDAMYDRAFAAFQAGVQMQARGARVEGRLVGIVHFLVHASTSSADVCYLQDLFTEESARGLGVGRALIGEVVAWAKAQGCCRVYWMTHETNARGGSGNSDRAIGGFTA